ncbi:MAG TPA: molybdopterin molybdotransferase MoeA, partial [Urbifossiella sp.]|nr:molybdopterin molybdotransferase MoeA [Urbifossiella sp.]
MTAPFFDVRNKGFGPRTPVADVFKLLDARVASLPAEAVSLGEAAGRVLAGSVTAAVNIPGFARAAMDGFAVRAADARIDNPLSLVGESLPGRPFAGTVATGQAVRIMTGAPLPNGADAVLRVEAAEEAEGRVRAQAAIAPGRDLGRIGEDVLAGSEVLAAGRRLRPQDVGMLAALGIGTIAAIRRPRVAILATGDELLPPGSKPEGCRIVDSNSPMLAALIHRDGGVPLPVRYVPDRLEAVRTALAEADADAIVVSGGSSVGKEDHAPR